MSGGLALLLAALLPLAWAPVVLSPTAHRVGLALAPWSALPALLLAWLLPVHTQTFPWLLMGMRIGLDDTGRVFLLFTAWLWWLAGVFARAYLRADRRRPRFFAFYLATLCGNLGLIVAQDIASFYLFFALMTFAAYGLVVHTGSKAARRAGRVYIVLAVIGEMLLLAGFLLVAHAAGSIDLGGAPRAVAQSPARDLIVGLVLAGFGVKAGVLLLHVWLPLAHPVAPTPASAVLSGAMIKAGLLGWLRFLPLGEMALPEWGALCMAAGLLAVFYGVAIGLTQADAKTVLAYSSISQMGFMTVLVGAALLAPRAAGASLTAVLVFAVHHGLAKGALFLSVGVHGGPRPLLRLGQLVPALALAAAPWTSGAAAKYLLKGAVHAAPPPWPAWVDALLPLSSFATTLLLIRFLTLARHEPGRVSLDRWIPWSLAVISVGAVSLWAPVVPSSASVLEGLAPIGAAVAVALLLLRAPRRPRAPRLPPGDVLACVVTVSGWLRRVALPAFAALRAMIAGAARASRRPQKRARRAPVAAALRADAVAGAAFVLLVVLLFLLLVA